MVVGSGSYSGGEYFEIRHIPSNEWALTVSHVYTLKPRGVPFDCMPDWAESILKIIKIFRV